MEFDQLTETAQEHAITIIRGKLANEWFESEDGQMVADTMVYAFATAIGAPHADEYGEGDFPGIAHVKLSGWSIRDGGSVFLTGTLTPENAPALPWTDRLDSVVLESVGNGTSIVVREDRQSPTGAPFAEFDTMESAVQDAVNTGVSAGIAEFEYRTGEENARNYAENNATISFDEDGDIIDD
jgi:hypothetical protein